jgi:hypothetical protein
MDRPHRGPAGPARAGGAPVNAVTAPPRTMIEARDVVKSFRPTPALRGATVAAAQGEILAGVAYCLITAAGIGACLAIIAATFPLLGRITGPEKRMSLLSAQMLRAGGVIVL